MIEEANKGKHEVVANGNQCVRGWMMGSRVMRSAVKGTVSVGVIDKIAIADYKMLKRRRSFSLLIVEEEN